MRITLDRSANAAYIRLADTIPDGVANTHMTVLDFSAADVNLDFDKEGRLVGIEIMPASKGLPPDLLAIAEVIG